MSNLPIIHSLGLIGQQESRLIFIAFALMLIPLVPVMVMTLWFAWRYRVGNTHAAYRPRWHFSWPIEALVWGIPLLIVAGLSVLSALSTYRLDPYRPLASSVPPLEVEAIALDWNWLFIYPQENIASVNQLVIAEQTPIHLTLTSDTVMTTFFIPQLGSQIFAMAGMPTELHLQAQHRGDFLGLNSQISGPGFAAMHFRVLAKSDADYRRWVEKARAAHQALSAAAFARLENRAGVAPTLFSTVRRGLFACVLGKYRPNHQHRQAAAPACAEPAFAPNPLS